MKCNDAFVSCATFYVKRLFIGDYFTSFFPLCQLVKFSAPYLSDKIQVKKLSSYINNKSDKHFRSAND